MEKTGKISLFFILILSALLLAGCASVSSGSDTGVLSMRFFSTSAKSWGDCTYIVFPNGENMLIDCGTEKAGAEILDELRSLGADHIDYLVISHYHSDHVNGLKAILPAMDIRHAFVTGYYPTDFSWVERNLELYGTEIEYVKAGDSFSVGNVLFEVLWPTAQIVSERPDQASNAASGAGSVYDVNCHSMVLKMTYGKNTVLFTGDIYVEAETEIIRLYADNPGILDCDILKVMHHGYNNANSEAFIQAVCPEYAFSMGTATMEMLTYLYYYKVGTKVYMSWYNGNSQVIMDGSDIVVTCDRTGVNQGYLKYAEGWELLQQHKENL